MRIIILFITFIAFSFFTIGCQTVTLPSEPVKEAPSKPEVATPEIPKTTLSWNKAEKPERVAWTEKVVTLIGGELFETFDKAKDSTRFCKTYPSLTKDQKVQVWGEMIAWTSYFESGWSPVSRMKESTMGKDPITGLPVYSEGLLQLSYQDIQWAKFCAFDWSKDKALDPKDPKKTILDPLLNLDCGIRILAKQVERKGLVILSSGVYWAVLKDGGRYSEVNAITSKTQALPFCKAL